MKILLTAINAKYIHTNLAVHYLKAYAKDYADQITIREFTINQYTEDILQAIYREKPDFIGLSCYIWNISMVEELCLELRKLLPDLKIWLGGPEVSYDAKMRLEKSEDIDGIMIGEGEETFHDLLNYYILGTKELEEVKGIAFRESALKVQSPLEAALMAEELALNDLQSELTKTTSLTKITSFSNATPLSKEIVTITQYRPEMDLNKTPFPYKGMEEFKNKIIYYETSRGCPYSCSYCLSSIDKKVRLRDLELVKAELALFLEYKVPQVKFVDRTFNCNKQHAMAIWKYIREKDNGITNFHFEIAADILDEEEVKLLHSLRPGLVQLEIGVQSTNSKTVSAIHRKMDFLKLRHVVEQIHEGGNIHAHLDLIAGLPYEDLTSFRQSFCDVYSLNPDQFQLGFLKVLKGSAMYADSKEFGIVYKSTAPYEVLYTKWLTYDEVLTLKGVEDMVETYYNSGQFWHAIKYMEHFFKDPFELYLSLADFYERNQLLGIKHTRIRRYEILIDFMKERQKCEAEEIDLEAFHNILVHDLYLRENMKSRPVFAEDYEPYKELFKEFYRDEDGILGYIKENDFRVTPVQLKPNLHIERYETDVYQTAITGMTVRKVQFLLYDYMHRNILNSQAKVTEIIM